MYKTHHERKIEKVTSFASGILDATGNADLIPGLAELVPLLQGCIPTGTRLQGFAVLGDIAAWHAIKAAGRTVDQATFRAASQAGDMPLSARSWLLEYTRYLPSAARVVRPRGDPAALLDGLKAEYPLIHHVALDLLPRVLELFPQLTAKTIAGIAAWLACKITGRTGVSAVLSTVTPVRQSSVQNAIRRQATLAFDITPAELVARLVDAGTARHAVPRHASAGGGA